MAIKRYKPTSPGRRGMTVSTFEEITKSSPRSRCRSRCEEHCRPQQPGAHYIAQQGGGENHLYRIIDFKRNKLGIPARVDGIEYDPNRSARIALLQYADGEKRYILAPVGLKVGDRVMSGPRAEVRVGNALAAAGIPLGTQIHNIELQAGRGGQIVR